MTDYNSNLTVKQVRAIEPLASQFTPDELQILVREFTSGAVIQNLENRIEINRLMKHDGRVKQLRTILGKIITWRIKEIKHGT